MSNNETTNSVSFVGIEDIEEEPNLLINGEIEAKNNYPINEIKKVVCDLNNQQMVNNSETNELMDISFVGDNNCNNGLVMTNGDLNSDDNNGNNEDNEDQQLIDCDNHEDNGGEDKQMIICDKMKFDITESDDRIIVYCYVRNCQNVSVHYTEDTIEVTFNSNDPTFNASNNCDSNTTYVWKVTLRDKIIPQDCYERISSAKFEIHLKKKCTRFRWISLEQTQPQQITNKSFTTYEPIRGPQQQSARNNPMSDKWQPIISTEENSKRKELRSDNSSGAQLIKNSYDNQSVSSVGKELVAFNNNLINNGSNSVNNKYGYTGLDNLGNTCFMNAVIQCLSNSDPFRDYFSSGHYLQDVNETNPLGTGGQIANAFATLLKQLWLGKQSSVPPQRLKSLISEKVSQQFSGFAQHDAQELMAFLLDALHEDLNRIKQKPYIAVNNDDCDNGNVSDEQLADEAWKRYRMRNDSIVVDLFQGQFKSKLVCPLCGKISITFDPFLYLSVPFPKAPVVYDVFFFKREMNGMSTTKPIRYKIKLSHDAIVQNLLDYVSNETSVPTSALRLILSSKDGSVEKFLQPKWAIGKQQTGQYLLLFELLSPNEDIKEDIVEFVVIQRLSQPPKSDSCAKCDKNSGWDSVELKSCKTCYKVSYCDKNCQKEHWIQHKKDCFYRPQTIALPFVISVAKSQLTLRKLNPILYSYARHSVNLKKSYDYEALDYNLNEFPIPPPFQLREYRDSKSTETDVLISPQKELEEDEDIDYSIYDQPLEIKAYYIGLDWINSKHFGYNWVEVESFGLDSSTDPKSKEIADRSDIFTLEDCLRLFTEPEVLNPQEAWYCPKCKENREATKQIALWRLPQILVIQLKRFSFRNIIWRDKIDRMVRFPVKGLDISEFFCRTEYDPEFRPIYDLYGVVNHYGGMFGGHYTAFAKSSNNLENLGWRSFDDSRVDDVEAVEETVINRNAYMLFYKLRE